VSSVSEKKGRGRECVPIVVARETVDERLSWRCLLVHDPIRLVARRGRGGAEAIRVKRMPVILAPKLKDADWSQGERHGTKKNRAQIRT
jgi:hypothetical protein